MSIYVLSNQFLCIILCVKSKIQKLGYVTVKISSSRGTWKYHFKECHRMTLALPIRVYGSILLHPVSFSLILLQETFAWNYNCCWAGSSRSMSHKLLLQFLLLLCLQFYCSTLVRLISSMFCFYHACLFCAHGCIFPLCFTSVFLLYIDDIPHLYVFTVFL